MDLINEEARRLALHMILDADLRFGLRIKGGLQALNLVSGSKSHKMMSGRARDEFMRIWNSVKWHDRSSVMPMTFFICRAYEKVPRGTSHEALDLALLKSRLRIRDGELRRIVDKSPVDLKDLKEQPRES